MVCENCKERPETHFTKGKWVCEVCYTLLTANESYKCLKGGGEGR